MMFGMRDAFDYAECLDCGRLKLLNPPSDLTRYYPCGYYSFAGISKRDSLKNAVRSALSGVGLVSPAKWAWAAETTSIVALIGAHRNMRLLDVGGGSGKFVRELRSAGFKDALAIDPFLTAETAYAKRATIHTTKGEWDCIIFNHSFEHIADQSGTLLQARSMLARGGLCLIRVPVASSWAWKEYGINWVQLDCPRHMVIHTAKSMQLLARACGLKLASTVYDSTALQFWGSEAYRKDISLVDIQREMSMNLSKSQMAEFEKRAHELNQQHCGDQAAFILQPTG